MESYRKIYCNINTACNYKCDNCILSKEKRDARINPSLSLIDLQTALADISGVIQDGVNNICEISGGEPTIHPEFKEICAWLGIYRDASVLYKLVVLSNCHVLSSIERVASIADHIDDVVTAIYTPDERIHDEITGVNGSLTKKLKAIENLIKAGIDTHIKTLIFKSSYQQLPGIAELVGSNFGRDIHFTVNTTHFIGDAKSNYQDIAVKLTEAAPFVEEAIDVAQSYGARIGLFFPMCMIDPIYWEHTSLDYAAQVKKTLAITPTGKRFIRAKDLEREFVERHDICKTCPLNMRCSWPWHSYVSIFGDQELIDGRQNLNTIMED